MSYYVVSMWFAFPMLTRQLQYIRATHLSVRLLRTMSAPPCCPPGSHGYLDYAQYKTLGQEIKLANGTEAYVTGQPGKNALLIVPDVYGWAGGRVRALADHFAAANQRYVVVPKLLTPALREGTHGDGLPADFDWSTQGGEFGPFLHTIPWETNMKPKFEAVFAHLSEKGAENIASIGFCWGCWTLCKVAESFPKKLSCAAWPHPSVSNIEQYVFQGDSTQRALNMDCPVLIMSAQNDPDLYRENGEMYLKLKEKVDVKTVDFPTEQHGWLSRGDASNAQTHAAIEKALGLIVPFFQQHSL